MYQKHGRLSKMHLNNNILYVKKKKKKKKKKFERSELLLIKCDVNSFQASSQKNADAIRYFCVG